jgi:hypothetical protein
MLRRKLLASAVAAPWILGAAQAHARSREPSARMVAWAAPAELARGGGERGPWQQNDSAYDFVDDPAVAVWPNGTAAVCWVDQARKAVMFQRLSVDGTAQLPRPVDVSRQARTFSWLPRVALAPDAPQQIYVLWQEIIFSGGSHGGDMFIARSLDGGSRFAPPINLSQSKSGAGKGRLSALRWDNGSYDLVAGPDGVLHVVWTDYEGPLWHCRSIDGGMRFSEPRELSRGSGAPLRAARAPSISIGPRGTIYVAWTSGDDPEADIFMTLSEDGGERFKGPSVVASLRGHSDAPRVTVDRAGMIHLVFAHGEYGPQGGYRVLYTQSEDRGASFAPPRELSSPLPSGRNSAGFPQLAIDARGSVLVTWELFAYGYARGLGWACSQDRGRSFGRPAVVPHSTDPSGGINGSSQGLLTQKLGMNDAGAFVVVNSSLRHGSGSRVWLMRGQVA